MGLAADGIFRGAAAAQHLLGEKPHGFARPGKTLSSAHHLLIVRFAKRSKHAAVARTIGLPTLMNGNLHCPNNSFVTQSARAA